MSKWSLWWRDGRLPFLCLFHLVGGLLALLGLWIARSAGEQARLIWYGLTPWPVLNGLLAAAVILAGVIAGIAALGMGVGFIVAAWAALWDTEDHT